MILNAGERATRPRCCHLAVAAVLLLTSVQRGLQCSSSSAKADRVLNDLIECANHCLSCVGVGCTHAAVLL
jgi:hypothetical protein